MQGSGHNEVEPSAAAPSDLTFAAQETDSSVSSKWQSANGAQYGLGAGARLMEGSDCTVSCFDNLLAGTAAVQIMGTDNYEGAIGCTFRISLMDDVSIRSSVNINDAQIVYDVALDLWTGEGADTLYGLLLAALGNGWDVEELASVVIVNGDDVVDALDARAIQVFYLAEVAFVFCDACLPFCRDDAGGASKRTVPIGTL